MRPGSAVFRGIFSLALLGMAVGAWPPISYGQGNGYERAFPQSKATIEKMLQDNANRRTPARCGWFCDIEFAGSSSGSVPAWLLRVQVSSERGAWGWFGSARGGAGYCLVCRPGCSQVWISVADFEWPD